MTDNKEILKKLYKIAQNQQKIIRKMAQAMPTDPQAGGAVAAKYQAPVDQLAKLAGQGFVAKVVTAFESPAGDSIDLTIGVQGEPGLAVALNEAVARFGTAVLVPFTKVAGKNVKNITFNQN